MENNFEQISKVSGFMKHNGGLLFRDISETEFEFKSTIQKIHLNRRDITHGGFICSLIDAGAGTAVYRASNNQSCVTVSLDVKFIAPSRLGDEILGKVREAVRKIAIDKGFDYIMDSSMGLLYAKPNYDVTDDVLHELRNLKAEK